MFIFPSGNGLGIRVVGGKEIPGSRGEIGAYIAKVIPGGVAEQTGKVLEGKRRMRKQSGINWCLSAPVGFLYFLVVLLFLEWKNRRYNVKFGIQ